MQKKLYEQIPHSIDLLLPTFQALKELGGSGKSDEILTCVIRDLHLPDEVVDLPHNGRASLSELAYRLAWARACLKKSGVIESSSRNVWSIDPEYTKVEALDVKRIVQSVKPDQNEEPEGAGISIPDEVKPWRQRLQEILQTMNPYGFERLAQRILRECGFMQVEVKKRSGDGGIDGTGKLSINGLFSLNVAFQCRRYTGIVGAGEIRDFRASLDNDIEKGLLMTTGTFSEAAKLEAVDPGKRLIDLMDGEELIDKIAEYHIGVHEVRSYEINEEFFRKI